MDTDTTTAEAPAAENPAAPAVPNLIEPAVTETPAVPAEEAAVEEKPAKKHDPVVDAFARERGRRRELEAALQTAQREAQAAKELAQRLSRGEKHGRPARRLYDDPQRQQQQLDAEINRRAAFQVFLRDVAQVRSRGVREFGEDFNASIARLKEYGADDNDFVHQVITVDPDNAHAVLHSLAQDPGKAYSLVEMSPVQRIAEITRMSINHQKTPAKTEEKATAPAAKTVSAAPRPAPAISTTTKQDIVWYSDKASDKEYDKGFFEMLKNRRARR